ncbi:MAG TPA: DUF2867 domain-containing protein [Gemmatimonadales bacterium]|nr:DUF2867 domain-containing protein [Gemmatimonadales bacterium]
MSEPVPVLLTGATGYVGGRLLQRLERKGIPVRCLARRPEFLRSRAAPATEVVAGDVMQRETLDRAMAGVRTAFYLVHSMGASGEFEELDRAAAANFADAARQAGVRRIIYLGGLGESAGALSTHLRSRQETGEVLRRHAGDTEVVELRASIIIGSGSASFEMIRALVERLPVMITPRWVSVLAQPIAIEDVLAYLEEAIGLPATGHRIFEIGGRDVTSYREIMQEYARQRGLRRIMIPVPLLTPRLSSLWLGLVTPLYARVGRRLIDSMRHPTVVRDPSSLQAFTVRPRGTAEAVALALRNEDRERAETTWSSAVSSLGAARPWGGVRLRNQLVDSRTARVSVPPGQAFAPILRLGGRNGWYYGNWLWTLRGWIDLLAGGAGMRRGRRHPTQLVAGDPLDCWRVDACEPPHRLLLAAEMKLPGRAWLSFEVTPDGTGSIIRQTAVFDPLGLPGLIYWYLAWPLHQLVFAGMLSGIARAAAGGGHDATDGGERSDAARVPVPADRADGEEISPRVSAGAVAEADAGAGRVRREVYDGLPGGISGRLVRQGPAMPRTP